MPQTTSATAAATNAWSTASGLTPAIHIIVVVVSPTTEPDPPEVVKPHYPHPWTSFAVHPKKQGDDQKMGEGLRRLATEDPSFHMRREEATNELLIEGLSDLHVQILLDRLKQRQKVEVETTLPKIPYKETIASKSEGHYRHKKQTGGRGQFEIGRAHV